MFSMLRDKPVPARFILALLIAGAFLLPSIEMVLIRSLSLRENQASILYTDLFLPLFFLLLFTIIGTINHQSNIQRWLPQPGKRQIVYYMSLSIPMIGVSSLDSSLFLSLSYIAPDFFEHSHSEAFTESAWLLIVTYASKTIFYPLFEELVFRGFLLNRWETKYSPKVAVILSSLLFAVGHANILASFIFGFVLSLIYLHTRSLWGPIIIHITSNTGVLVINKAEEIWAYNIDLFLVNFLVGTLLVLPWLPRVYRAVKSGLFSKIPQPTSNQ